MTDSPSPRPQDQLSLVEAFHRLEQWVHGRALRLLNLEPGDREVQVHGMLAARQRGTVEYWTFLALSMSIATLGLAMDSTTVVIGAMLVSPLMGPIVEFAMGLVVGSPVLTVRSVIRIVGSVALVVAGSALITLVLPFKEITSEIAARTEPTLLDMALAVCVAVAAALTTVKARSETNIVAAGAAIGIALVPPICVVGFGVGTADAEIWMGAFLLLVTNFFAIISVGVIFFYLLGYERVSVQVWDDEALAAARPDGPLRRLLLGLERIFGSRRSGFVRLLLPAALLGVLAVPLWEGLNQVTWEVGTRNAVRRILGEEASRFDLTSSWTVSDRRVSVRSTLVGGSLATRDSLEDLVALRIAAAANVEPDVRVTWVPNELALERVRAVPVVESGREEPEPGVELARFRQATANGLAQVWPVEAYGPVVGWHLQLSDGGSLELHVQHMGPAPDAGAARVLASALQPGLGAALRVRFDPVDTTGVRAEPAEALAWLPSLTRALETVRETSTVTVCIDLPRAPALSRTTDGRAVAAAVPELVESLPPDRVGLTTGGDLFVVRLVPDAGGEQGTAVEPNVGTGPAEVGEGAATTDVAPPATVGPPACAVSLPAVLDAER